MPPIQPNVFPLPKDIDILNFILIDLLLTIGIILLIVQRKKIFYEENDFLDKKTAKKNQRTVGRPYNNTSFVSKYTAYVHFQGIFNNRIYNSSSIFLLFRIRLDE